jgi:hypothetical protein
MIIDERRPCPGCANRRTVDLLNWGFICFNCQRQWGQPRPELATRRIPADEFTDRLLREPDVEPVAGL